MSLEQLAAHPRRFGRTHPLVVSKSGGPQRLTVGPTQAGAFYDRRQTTAKDTRILRARLTVDGDGVADVRISSAARGEACYWLQWGADRIIRTKLDDGGPGQPRFFFTAQLTGCSIFIETHNGRTVVYHANAQRGGAYPGQQGGRAFDSGCLEVRNRKSDLMRAGFQRVRSDVGGDFSEANAGDYWKHPMFHPPIEIGPEVKRHARHNAHVGRALLRTGNYVRDARLTDAYGVVFGVWKNDEWRFYQQSVISISYARRGHAQRRLALVIDRCERLH